MLRLLIAWASIVALATASLQPCTTQKFQTAFLSNVTSGLPPSVMNDFCIDARPIVITEPQDTGIVHYVLPGSIALDKLGKQNDTYSVLSVGEVAPLTSVQTAVSLHLWMRASCVG